VAGVSVACGRIWMIRLTNQVRFVMQGDLSLIDRRTGAVPV